MLKFLERLAGRNLFVLSSYGPLIRVNFGDLTWNLAYLGYPSSRVIEEVRKLVSGDCFLDVGANLGIFSLVAADIVGADGLVVSFEPNRQVFEDLISNVNRSRHSCPVILLNQGIANQAELVTLQYEATHTGGAYISDQAVPGKLVFVGPIADLAFLDRLIGDRNIILKVDVEGAECGVIRSIFSSYLRSRIGKIIIEIDDSKLARFGESRQSLIQFLTSLGFHAQFGDSSEHYDEVFVKQT